MKIVDVLAFEDAQILAQMAHREAVVARQEIYWSAAMCCLAVAYGRTI